MPIQLALLSLDAAAKPTATGPDLTRYLVVCGLLIALVVGLGWVFRRVVAGSLKLRAAQRSLQVIDLLPLGGKQRLAVVRCYDRTFALGLGEKEISLVAELDAVIAPRAEAPPRPADARAFKDLIDRALLRREVIAAPQPSKPSKPSVVAAKPSPQLSKELFG